MCEGHRGWCHFNLYASEGVTVYIYTAVYIYIEISSLSWVLDLTMHHCHIHGSMKEGHKH